MRSLHKFVITAGVLCHLFLTSTVVTSQTLAPQELQNQSPAGEQATPAPTPAEELPAFADPLQQSSSARVGNCHLVITSPPATTKPQLDTEPKKQAEPKNEKPNSTKEPARKVRVPISEEEPVIIDADECEKAGNTYTLTNNVEIRFNGYDFHGDTVTYDSVSGDVTAKGHVSLDGGRRD